MKVGIATFFESDNYGTVLQAYALQEYITSLGLDTEIISIKRDIHKSSGKYQHNSLKYSFLQKIFIKTNLFLHKSDDKIKKEAFSHFRQKLNISKIQYSYEMLINDCPKYDLYLSGGDQIWNPYHKSFSDVYMFSFVPYCCNIVSFGSSFGVDKIEEDIIKKDIKSCLSKYKFIGVRENSGVEIIKSLGLLASQVVDPVFLIKDKWQSFINQSKSKCKYCVIYAINEYPFEEDTFIKEYARKNRLKIVILPETKRNLSTPYRKLFSISPEAFLSLISKAEAIFTNSFHGAAFSVLFNKNFVLLGICGEEAQAKRARLDNFLLDLNLKDCQNIKHIYDGIDYGFVNSILDIKISKSKKFLSNILNNI